MSKPLFELQIQSQLLGQQAKAFSMVNRRAKLAEGLTVFSRWVALVLLPVVLGKFLGQLRHIVVAVGFGQNRCGGDGSVFGIALDDTDVGYVFIRVKFVAVHGDKFGYGLELVQGAVHGGNRGVEYIDLVDFFGKDMNHGKGEGLGFNLRAEI